MFKLLTMKGKGNIMPKRTLRARLITYLTVARECTLLDNMNRKKYIALRLPNREIERYYFVGKNGAVRYGRCISQAISVTDKMHSRLHIWEQSSIGD